MPDTLEWTLIAAIETAIRQDGETQRDLAEKLDWNNAEVRLSKILNGKQRLLAEDLRQIARAQGRDYSWYFEPPPIIHVIPMWFGRPIDINANNLVRSAA